MLCLVKVLLQVHQQTFFNINDAFQLISCACIHNSASLLQNRLGFYVYLFFALALGQLYVMMSPQEVLTGANQRSIAPRTQPYNA